MFGHFRSHHLRAVCWRPHIRRRNCVFGWFRRRNNRGAVANRRLRFEGSTREGDERGAMPRQWRRNVVVVGRHGTNMGQVTSNNSLESRRSTSAAQLTRYVA